MKTKTECSAYLGYRAAMTSIEAETTESVASRPRWLREIAAAKAKVFESLSPEERAEASQALLEASKRSKARNAAVLERAKRIFDLYLDGRTASEIAAAVNRSADSVRKFARARGLSISRSEAAVGYRVPVSMERRDALARMAGDRGTTPAQALEDLITFGLDEDAAIARRILHVTRR